jgi:hypothetical protein
MNMKYRNKSFLNGSHLEFGNISWHILAGRHVGRYYLIESSLRIADCGNVITLDFDVEKPHEIPYRLAKLDTLINSLTEMRERYKEAAECINKQKKFYY